MILLVVAVSYGSSPWYDRAVCRDLDTEIFFTHGNGFAYEAKQICATCPVMSACLAAAMEEEEHTYNFRRYRFGIRGGTTPAERHRMAGTWHPAWRREPPAWGIAGGSDGSATAAAGRSDPRTTNSIR